VQLDCLLLWYNGAVPIDIFCVAREAMTRNAMDKSYQSIISINPNIRGGKPIIRGLRYTVYDVLSYLAAGMTTAEIVEDFPDLTEQDIQACLSFAADRERTVVIVPA
jgi:uncharacterized protein (DUF433 family)